MAAEPAYIREFKAFIKSPLRLTDLAPLEAELYGSSDRALGVLRASLLESALEQYIRSYLRPNLDADSDRRLFEFSGSLGSFGAKILVAYSFNWIGQDTRHDLELIRLMRNEFAHCRKPIAFTDPPVSAVCKYLRSPDWADAEIPMGSLSRAASEAPPDETDKSNPRTRYVTATFTLSGRFLRAKRQQNSATLP